MRTTVLALLAVGALLGIEFGQVRATNFGGYDEWFLIDLVGRWIVAIPYTNRPLHYLWALPARALVPHSLGGFLLVHVWWLLMTAWLVFALVRRLFPRDRPLAFLAGVIAAVWTASDPLRLSSTVGLVGYAGPTAGAMAAIVCLLEAFHRRSWPFLALAGLIAAVATRAFEGVLPLLVLAPLLLLWTRPARVPKAWVLLWEGLAGALALLVLRPVLSGQTAENYQISGLGLDLSPWRVALRLLRQFGFQLLPLVSSPPREIAEAATSAALAVVVFASASWYVARADDEIGARGPAAGDGRATASADRRRLAWGLLLGLAMAALGYSVFVLSAAITQPLRTQFLSAPGIALVLACLVRLAASVFPTGARLPVATVLGCWIVAVGVGRTAELQREADRTSYWSQQNDSLVQLTDQAPGLKPNTLVLLIDEPQTWPAGFTFRHALSYLYEGSAIGVVWGALQVYYPWSFVPQGVVVAPWRTLRAPWLAPVTFHRYDEMVVFRLRADGRLQLEGSWPPELPPLPQGAVYAPRSRILPSAALPPSRAILRRAP